MQYTGQRYQPRRTRSQWAAIIARQRASGLSAKAFCEHEALSYGSFTNWRSELKREGIKVRAEDFVELRTEPMGVAASTMNETGAVIELQIGASITLRIYPAS